MFRAFFSGIAALYELMGERRATVDAWIIKEMLRWIQLACKGQPLLKPMAPTLNTLARHAEYMVMRCIAGVVNELEL
tara:strand:+ start:9944 stop:10174 length:231 start_codon:yes stop_codon:yes gene_type:complete